MVPTNFKTLFEKKYILLNGILLLLIYIFTTTCIEEFNPNLGVEVDLLSVDASIVRGREEQSVIITRSTSIDNLEYIAVRNCKVFVTDDKDNKFHFKEQTDGEYTAKINEQYLTVGAKFKLTIITPDDKVYESGYEEIYDCPPVDSLYFTEETYNYNNGLMLNLNLQNREGFTKYYRWTIDETWEDRSVIEKIDKKLTGIMNLDIEIMIFTEDSNTIFFMPDYDVFGHQKKDDSVILVYGYIVWKEYLDFDIEDIYEYLEFDMEKSKNRLDLYHLFSYYLTYHLVDSCEIITLPLPVFDDFNKRDSLHQCWKNSVANGLYSAATSNLITDGRKNIPLHFIPGDNERLNIRYSCLVNQYSLSEGAYNYWQNKKTEIQESGGMYFSQPGQTISNIKNINNEQEAVLGYFWTSTVGKKRIFYNGTSQSCNDFYCGMDSFNIWNYVIETFLDDGTIKYVLKDPENSHVYSYTSMGIYITADKSCFDCRFNGGTINRPDYW